MKLSYRSDPNRHDRNIRRQRQISGKSPWKSTRSDYRKQQRNYAKKRRMKNNKRAILITLGLIFLMALLAAIYISREAYKI